MTPAPPRRRGRRVGVVVNPTAGKGRARSAGHDVVETLLAAGHDVHDLSGPSADLALEHARRAVADGIDALVVVGGDGMVHLGVEAVGGTPVPLGVVAVGTGNDFAAVLDLPVHRPAAASAVVLGALTGTGEPRARAVDAVHVTGAGLAGTHPRGRWYAGALSAGVDAAVNARANALTFPRGSSRYALAALAEIARFRPYAYRLVLDGVPAGALPATGPDGAAWSAPGGRLEWSGRSALVAVANGGRIGGGIRVAPGASVTDGLLDVVVAGAVGRAGAAGIFPGMYAGRHVRHPLVRVLRARSVTLEALDVDGAPVPPLAYADGEALGALPLTATVVPGALRVLAASA